MKELYIQQKENYWEDICEALGVDYCYKNDTLIQSEEWEIMCGILFDNDIEVDLAAGIVKEYFNHFKKNK